MKSILVEKGVATPEECELLKNVYDKSSWYSTLEQDGNGNSVLSAQNMYGIPGVFPEEYDVVVSIKKRMLNIARDTLYDASAERSVYIHSSHITVHHEGQGVEIREGERPFSILYLNDGFKGGEIHGVWEPYLIVRRSQPYPFTDKPVTGSVIFLPPCDYGFNDTKFGSRYSFVQWYTCTPEAQEVFNSSKPEQSIL